MLSTQLYSGCDRQSQLSRCLDRVGRWIVTWIIRYATRHSLSRFIARVCLQGDHLVSHCSDDDVMSI